MYYGWLVVEHGNDGRGKPQRHVGSLLVVYLCVCSSNLQKSAKDCSPARKGLMINWPQWTTMSRT
jgi:hypothetical protein